MSNTSAIPSPLSNPMSNLLNAVELLRFSSTPYYKLLYSMKIFNDNEKVVDVSLSY